MNNITDNQKLLSAEEKKKEIFERLKEPYQQVGMSIVPIKGGSHHSTYAVGFPFDDVQYVVDDHGHYLKGDGLDDILHSKKYLKIIQKFHHHQIKKIYEHLMQQKEILGDIWVLSGGGMQVQAFFGNKDGYLGILYLNLDEIYSKPLKKEKEYTLMVERHQNNIYFEGLKVPGIQIKPSDNIIINGKLVSFKATQQKQSPKP